jgi:hypothetical protein
MPFWLEIHLITRWGLYNFYRSPSDKGSLNSFHIVPKKREQFFMIQPRRVTMETLEIYKHVAHAMHNT